MIPEVKKTSVVYQCDGANKKWIWPYDFNKVEDIALIIVDADENRILKTRNISYDKENKTLIYPTIGEALDNTHKVILERKTPIEQCTDLPDIYPFQNIEKMFDKITLILQEVQDNVYNSLITRLGSDIDSSMVLRKIANASSAAANDAIDAFADKKMVITHPLFGEGMTQSGDCTFIGIDGKWFIIDSLAKSDANLNSILKCMDDNKIDEFEFGFVSHYHDDHIGNFIELIKSGKISKMYLPDNNKTVVTGRYGKSAEALTKVSNDIKQACSDKKIPFEIITPKVLDFYGAKLTFYNCSDDDYEYYKSINNDDYNNVSACLEINYLNRTAIFEGDCSYPAMEHNALRNPINVDYLKSNHHGISNVPLSYRKVNPRDIVMTTTQDIARSNLYIQNFQNTFQQLGSNIYLLGDQIEPPMITYKGDGSITYNRKLLRDGTAGHATSLEIFVDRNYTGKLKTGDEHSPFVYLADAVRFINQIKHASVTVNIKAGDYTRAEDKGSVYQPRKELTIQNVNNRVILQRQGEGVVNLPPLVIRCCKYIYFKDVEFIGVSAGDNRKIRIYNTNCTFENCQLNSIKQPTNNESNVVVIQSEENSMLKLIDVNFTAGWGAIQVVGGMCLLTGTENHCSTDHAYVLQSGIIMVETPFVEKNNVNKFNDAAAKEVGQVYFKAVANEDSMPSNLMAGTIIPAKNKDFPQITQFVQMKNTKLSDYVYSLVDVSKKTVPVFTGQIGYSGEQVFFGINGKWIKISNDIK